MRRHAESADPSLAVGAERTEHHHVFRRKNSGRLALTSADYGGLLYTRQLSVPSRARKTCQFSTGSAIPC